MTTHTPGPWKLNADNTHLAFVILGADGTEVATPKTKISPACADWLNKKARAKTLWYGIATPTERANARLIAAAPGLLEALKSILDGGIADLSEVTKAHAAIAKAEGRN